MSALKYFFAALLTLTSSASVLWAQDTPARVTIVSDAFGKDSALERSWGWSALIEYGGKRILFDTGGTNKAFANNVKNMSIDLRTLDFVVLSHRHGDHTGGVPHLLEVNPEVKIYAPLETGSFGTPASGPILSAAQRHVEGLPNDLHYYGGNPPNHIPVDAAWPEANITLVDKPVEVLPGFYLFKTVSDEKGTLELNEVSLAIKTPKGLVVVVGCSHPGIERIFGEAAKIDPNLYSVVGGLHLVNKTDQQITTLADAFQSKWKLERVAAGHCTGPFAQSEFRRVYGDRHDHSGLGEVISLPK
jgi:7,8-dihydropterin-6-yl-methyl-4-(beta-D-ribofuranosyl)aminobenzene 5'-phosphate synthase